MSQNGTPNKPRKPRKFRNTVFLFRMLASVFAVQISIILFSFKSCYEFTMEKNAVVSDVCPHLTDKFESTTTTMIATVLSLMVGKEIRDK